MYLDIPRQSQPSNRIPFKLSNNIVTQDLDEALVHKYYVDTYVDATLNDLQILRIASGNTIVEALDATDGLNESRVDFMMDSSLYSLSQTELN